jgi:histone-binding protein RBBP4
MSSSADGCVFIWDNSKAGEEQARHDYEDGPPEMIFPHELHQKVNVEDIGWSPFEEDHLMAVSVDTQMSMQVWKMSEDFLFNEVDFLDNMDMIKLEHLE